MNARADCAFQAGWETLGDTLGLTIVSVGAYGAVKRVNPLPVLGESIFAKASPYVIGAAVLRSAASGYANAKPGGYCGK